MLLETADAATATMYIVFSTNLLNQFQTTKASKKKKKIE